MKTVQEMAADMQLEPCEGYDECNHCENDNPNSAAWAKVVRGMDFEEVDYFVCEKCLPQVYDGHERQLAQNIEYAEDELNKLSGAPK